MSKETSHKKSFFYLPTILSGIVFLVITTILGGFLASQKSFLLVEPATPDESTWILGMSGSGTGNRHTENTQSQIADGSLTLFEFSQMTLKKAHPIRSIELKLNQNTGPVTVKIGQMTRDRTTSIILSPNSF